MPIVNIERNNKKVTKEELGDLHLEIQELLVNATGMKDVIVMTNSPESMHGDDGVEIFVRLSEVKDLDNLLQVCSEELKRWKDRTGFKYKLNLTIIPMDWKIKAGI